MSNLATINGRRLVLLLFGCCCDICHAYCCRSSFVSRREKWPRSRAAFELDDVTASSSSSSSSFSSSSSSSSCIEPQDDGWWVTRLGECRNADAAWELLQQEARLLQEQQELSRHDDDDGSNHHHDNYSIIPEDAWIQVILAYASNRDDPHLPTVARVVQHQQDYCRIIQPQRRRNHDEYDSSIMITMATYNAWLQAHRNAGDGPGAVRILQDVIERYRRSRGLGDDHDDDTYHNENDDASLMIPLPPPRPNTRSFLLVLQALAANNNDHNTNIESEHRHDSTMIHPVEQVLQWGLDLSADANTHDDVEILHPSQLLQSLQVLARHQHPDDHNAQQLYEVVQAFFSERQHDDNRMMMMAGSDAQRAAFASSSSTT